MLRSIIEIQNLKCSGCAKTIKDELSLIEGISEITVDNATNKVTLNHASTDVLNKAVTKLSKLGYPEVGDENSITKKARSYVSCAIGRINS